MMARIVLATRPLVRPSLLAGRASQMVVAGGLVYAAVFLAFGISGDERRFYLSKLARARPRMRVLLPSVSEGA